MLFRLPGRPAAGARCYWRLLALTCAVVHDRRRQRPAGPARDRFAAVRLGPRHPDDSTAVGYRRAGSPWRRPPRPRSPNRSRPSLHGPATTRCSPRSGATPAVRLHGMRQRRRTAGSTRSSATACSWKLTPLSARGIPLGGRRWHLPPLLRQGGERVRPPPCRAAARSTRSPSSRARRTPSSARSRRAEGGGRTGLSPTSTRCGRRTPCTARSSRR